MNAAALVKREGHRLVGQRVMTDAVGDYPGGPAVVVTVDLEDDGMIVCFVKHPTWRSEGDPQCEGMMGIIHFENLEILPPEPVRIPLGRSPRNLA